LIGEEPLKRRNSFPFTPNNAGFYRLKARIEKDAQAFDNSLHAVLNVPKALNVLWINEYADITQRQKSTFFEVIAAAQQSGYEINLNSLTPDEMNGNDIMQSEVVVMDGIDEWPAYVEQSMIQFIQSGGGLWLIPSSKIDLQRWNQKVQAFGLPAFEGFLGEFGSFKKVTSFEQINVNHPVFENMFEAGSEANEAGWKPTVDAPSIYFHYLLPFDGGGFQSILENEARIPLLVEQKLGRGRIWLMALGFEAAWSDLSIKPLLPPLIFNGLQYLKVGSSSQFITNEELISPLYFPKLLNDQRSTAEVILNDSVQVLLQSDVYQNSSVWKSDIASWVPGYLQNGEQLFALEIPLVEKELQYVDFERMQQMPKRLQSAFEDGYLFRLDFRTEQRSNERTASIPPVYWLLLAAFIFLVGESLVARFFKITAKDVA